MSFWGYADSLLATQLKINKEKERLYYFPNNTIFEEHKGIGLCKRLTLEVLFTYNYEYDNERELLYANFLNKFMYISKSNKWKLYKQRFAVRKLLHITWTADE